MPASNRFVTLAPFLMMFLFALMGLAIIFIAPFKAFPDEDAHYDYAGYMKIHHSLPPLARESKDVTIPESFQPPLYYFCSSIFILSDDQSENIFFLRAFSLLLGIFTILVIAKTASRILPDFPPLVLLATACAAFNPQFLWSHCGISNISMTSFTSGLTILFSLRMMDSKTHVIRESVLLGICFGAALLSRTITVFLFPVCMLAILHRARKKFLAPSILFCGFALLISGWWFARNWVDYGDPLLWRVHQTTMGSQWARDGSFDLQYLMTALAFLHATFWAYFGRNQFHAGIWEYSAYLLIVLLSVIGVVEILLRRRGKDFEVPFQRSSFLLLVVCAFFAIAEVLIMQLKIQSPQGRYLYMAYPALGTLFGCGLLKIMPPRRHLSGALLFSIFLMVFCVYLFLRYAVPHYL